jgi:N-acetylglucosamine malate deacetylase 1
MKLRICFFLLAFVTVSSGLRAQDAPDKKLNIIIIGAHPDDAEKSGGSAYLWARDGHNVLLVSVTNGDAGHQSIPSKKLAKIRREEARRAGEAIGVRYITLDNHDGFLMPTIKNRLQIVKLIREHKADLVITHRTNDYHPDHRNTGALVLDAAYMVTVPKVLPKVRHLDKNPVFLWMSDGFQYPTPFKADVVVDIDEAIEKKIDMYHEHKSQMYEWLPFNRGNLDEVPETDAERRAWLGQRRKSGSNADHYRDKLIEIYGPERGNKIKYCEAFQDSGYGTRLTKENRYYYFPFLK